MSYSMDTIGIKKLSISGNFFFISIKLRSIISTSIVLIYSSMPFFFTANKNSIFPNKDKLYNFALKLLRLKSAFRLFLAETADF